MANPPFSLFREYLNVLVESEKKFIIIGTMNSLHYKEIFPLIKENIIWTGFSFNKTMEFVMPDSYELKGKAFVDSEGKKHGFVPGIIWYTNIDIKKRHERFFKPEDAHMYYEGNERIYPLYDNYNAIDIGRDRLDGTRVGDISMLPIDYTGIMGVPDSFLDKYNPEEFEILGCTQRGCHDLVPDTKKYNDYWEMRQDGTRTKASGNKTNENGNLARNDGKHNYFINAEGHIVQSTYSRIFIRNRHPVAKKDDI